jgi:hypothetical protein
MAQHRQQFVECRGAIYYFSIWPNFTAADAPEMHNYKRTALLAEWMSNAT